MSTQIVVQCDVCHTREDDPKSMHEARASRLRHGWVELLITAVTSRALLPGAALPEPKHVDLCETCSARLFDHMPQLREAAHRAVLSANAMKQWADKFTDEE